MILPIRLATNTNGVYDVDMKRRIGILMAVALLAIYGVLAHQRGMWPFSSPVGLKTFTNGVGGYSFQYPSAWNAVENSYSARDTLFGTGASATSGLGGIEIRDFTGNTEQFMAGVEAQYSDIQNVTIAGLTGIRAHVSSVGTEGISYLLQKDGQIINIYINSDNAGDIASLDALAHSFTFTK